MHPYYEDALGRAFHEEVARVEPAYVLPQVLAGARRREAWLLALVATVGALFILAGLVLLWGQEQPAPAPAPASSTHVWEA